MVMDMAEIMIKEVVYTMASHRLRFQRENPKLKIVNGSADELLLRWAAEAGYCVLVSFGEYLYYTEVELEKAKMWAEKMGRVF